MRGYLFSPDVVRVVFVTGVVVSVVFYERMQLTTGGAIVPGYMALSVEYPASLVSTLLAGYLTWLVVNKVIVRRKILYGRRKFELELLVGVGFVTLSILIELLAGIFTRGDAALATIGFLVPGVIAHDMFRQGPKKTLVAIFATTVILACLLVIFKTVLPLFGANPRPVRTLAWVSGYDSRLRVPAVAISVLISMVVYERLSIRCGGFIGGAYLAYMAPRWGDLLFVAFVAFFTWFVVVKIMMPRLLLFGRRKLSTIVLVGALIGWTVDICVRLVTDGRYEPGLGLPLMILMVPALIADDAQRQGWGRTVLGVGLSTSGVYGVVNLLSALLVGIGALRAGTSLSWFSAYAPAILLAFLGVVAFWLLRLREPQSSAVIGRP